MKKTILLLFSLAIISNLPLFGQQVQWSGDQIKVFSSEWTGERTADGRPRVSDDLVKRLANISLEEAWGFLKNKGYNNQFEAGWQLIHPEIPLAGRVVTAQYLPTRPDIDTKIREKGKAEGKSLAREGLATIGPQERRHCPERPSVRSAKQALQAAYRIRPSLPLRHVPHLYRR